MPILKPIAGHTSTARIEAYLEKNGRALARDFYNLSWDENQMAGKNEYNITVNFPGDKSLVGQIVKVKITSAGESTLRGERVD